MALDRAVILSLSHIASDGRVLRQAQACVRTGARVVLVGIEGSQQLPALLAGMPNLTISKPVWPLSRKLVDALWMLSARLPLGTERCLDIARQLPGVADIERVLVTHLAQLDNPAGTIVVANDWMTLPAAVKAKRQFGLPFHYDTHEFALVEHAHRADWRLLFPPLISAVERLGLQLGQSASCVAPGISRAMAEAYGLRRPPEVVMNVPDAQPLTPRPPGKTVSVLYHGLFNPNRGLERLIESAALWHPRFRLVLRGKAPDPRFERRLRDLASAPALADRVTFEPMVSQSDVITAANSADIGVFLPDLGSPQNRYALPNKLFEYLHAGLMVVVPAQTDMAAVIEPLGVGLALADITIPRTLADAVSALSSEDIYAFKRRAHAAATLLAWEKEEAKLMGLLTLRGAMPL